MDRSELSKIKEALHAIAPDGEVVAVLKKVHNYKEVDKADFFIAKNLWDLITGLDNLGNLRENLMMTVALGYISTFFEGLNTVFKAAAIELDDTTCLAPQGIIPKGTVHGAILSLNRLQAAYKGVKRQS